jgi:hypothetical protein
MVFAVSSERMNQWDLTEILKNTPLISSMLINVWMFILKPEHSWGSFFWELDELYFNNWAFLADINWKVRKKRTWRDQIFAIKLFLKEVSNIEFKEHFELYFQDREMYFLVWNVINRNNWTDQGLDEALQKIKKHVSVSFCTDMIDLKAFKPKINLFLWDEIDRYIKMQRQTSLLLKSNKLVISNCWVTELMFHNWVTQKGYFSELIFRDWVIGVPECVYSKCKSDIKFIQFIGCWFFIFEFLKEYKKALPVELGGKNVTEFPDYDDMTIDPEWGYEDACEHRKDLEKILQTKFKSEADAKAALILFIESIGIYSNIQDIEFHDCDFKEVEKSEEEGVKMVLEIS